jgi:hypothetical protein
MLLAGLISPTLTLSTRLSRDHFQGGVVRVRCEAIIYTLWGESSEGIYPGVGRSCIYPGVGRSHIYPGVGRVHIYPGLGRSHN